ncbi:MAG: DUF1326 domain-containing protein [Chloroflexi bacterium]|nr:DUF1326 domain-containing protein [Chloroflexota bacterium]
MAYSLEGSILEVCDCGVLCPCWVGEDPDNGTCDAIVAYHFDRGRIDGVDVTGLTLGLAVHIPGNILKGNWRALVCVDERATPQQEEALLNVFTGKLGGPVADLVQLVGEVVGVERMPITYQVREGKGSLTLGSLAEAELAPFTGPTGAVTTLSESIFSTIPGSSAWLSKASTYQRRTSRYGLKDLSLQGHNAVQGTFRFEA